MVRELAARALREYGYTVLEAKDVAGALRYVELPNLAIVVSAVVAPRQGGEDLPTELARRRPGLAWTPRKTPGGPTLEPCPATSSAAAPVVTPSTSSVR